MDTKELKRFTRLSAECFIKHLLAQGEQGNITIRQHNLPSVMFSLHGKQATNADREFIQTLTSKVTHNEIRIVA